MSPITIPISLTKRTVSVSSAICPRRDDAKPSYCNHYMGHLNLIRIVIIIHHVDPSLLPVDGIFTSCSSKYAFNVHFYCPFIPITRISHSFDWHNILLLLVTRKELNWNYLADFDRLL